MIRAKKKDFIFRQGNCTMNVLHPSLSKSIAFSICSMDPTEKSTLRYFCKITCSQMHCKLQSWCLFGRWLLCSLLVRRWSIRKALACHFIKKESLAQVFSCEFCKISKNNFFHRTPLVAASVFNLKFFILVLRHMFCWPKPSII